MKAIMVMFDSLNRRFLPPYGCDWVHAPNFQRLAEHSVTFDNCYAGSMPCMPARRELHTGRYNFLHRSWGPLEPFDDSMPEMLSCAGIYTHMVTDHQHYWEDGGATYHNRYDSHEFFRGQEGDPWKAQVPEKRNTTHRDVHNTIRRQDEINRKYFTNEADHPQTKVFDAGLEFIRTNRDRDDWFLQIETFDPHEPFFSYDKYRELYARPHDGPKTDWPQYERVHQSPETVQYIRDQYAALVTMCDASLGRVLDMMDQENLWDDTMLIVCTDHGFLLGEHDWWAKMVQPWYDENIHTPLFIWDPRSKVQDQRRSSLVQTIDIAPTLLEYFDLPRTKDMEGRPLRQVIEDDRPVRNACLFGAFGLQVNVTDGRYVYMRGPETPQNQPLFQHTLMPTHMHRRFNPDELRGAKVTEEFPFTKSAPVLQVPASRAEPEDSAVTQTLLYDLQKDPMQLAPLYDPPVELRMIGLMLDLMRRNHAPYSQYQRLGLPVFGVATEKHMRITREMA